jgi:hypothetical protein
LVKDVHIIRKLLKKLKRKSIRKLLNKCNRIKLNIVSKRIYRKVEEYKIVYKNKQRIILMLIIIIIIKLMIKLVILNKY